MKRVLLRKNEVASGLYRYPDGTEYYDPNTANGRNAIDMTIIRALEAQNNRCAICGKYIDIITADRDHIKPCGAGGGFRDDRRVNIQATCRRCNSDKASKRTGPGAFHATDYSEVP